MSAQGGAGDEIATVDEQLAAVVRADPGLREAVERIAKELRRRGNPSDLTDEAVAKLLDLNAGYLDDVAVEAIRLARDNRSDVVSANDVDEADRLLRKRTHFRRTVVMNTIGGLLAGAGIEGLW